MAQDFTDRERATLSRASPPRKSGIRLGRIAGVELVADYSLLIIFVLIATNLALAVFPRWHPAWGPALDWLVATCAALAFFASVAAHELSHAVVGRMQGIPVRRITLFVFGGMAHAEREPGSPKAEFLMAIVGPVVSIAIGVASSALGGYFAYDAYRTYGDDPMAIARNVGPVATLLLWLGPVNLLLGFFNLIPGFPLDGGRVLRAILWGIMGDLRRATSWAASLGQAFAWLLMALGVAMMFGFTAPYLGGGFAQGLWLLFIGWFLNNAARMSYEQLLVRQALEDVPVRDVMRSRVFTVSPELPLSMFVRDYVMNSDQQAFPVVEDGVLRGLVRMEDIRNVPHERWDVVTTGEAMLPREQMHTVRPDDDAMEALRELADTEALPVVENERLVGVARRDDILKWLALHTRTA